MACDLCTETLHTVIGYLLHLKKKPMNVVNSVEDHSKSRSGEEHEKN